MTSTAKSKWGAKKSWIIPLAILVAILGAWFGSYRYLWSNFPSNPTPNGIGDSFGAINALFSGVALGGVVLALFMQKEELGLQRDELRATRAEMEGQKEQLEAQVLAMNAANLDGLFFHLIDYLGSELRKVVINSGGSNRSGPKAIAVFTRGLEKGKEPAAMWKMMESYLGCLVALHVAVLSKNNDKYGPILRGLLSEEEWSLQHAMLKRGDFHKYQEMLEALAPWNRNATI